MKTTARFDFPCLPVNTTFTVRLMLTLKGNNTANKPSPVNLSMVIDRSGSMEGEKIAKVKEAAIMIAGMLQPWDVFSLVTFNDSVETIIPVAKGADLSGIESLIAKIIAGGNTNLSGGYEQGFKLASEATGLPNSRIVLLSDGQSNVGITAPDMLSKLAEKFRSDGVSTTTFGVGNDFDEDLLTGLAEQGGGSPYFIEYPLQAAEVFREELEDLRNIVAIGGTVRFIPSASVMSCTQLNNFPEIDKNNWFVGDVYSSKECNLVLELVLKTGLQTGNMSIGHFEVLFGGTDYNKPDKPFDIPLSLPVVADKDFSTCQADQEVTLMASFLVLGRGKREALILARNRKFHEAANLLESILNALVQLNLNDPELNTEFERMKERIWQLRHRGEEYFTASEQKYFAYEADLSMKGKKEKYLAMMDRKDSYNCRQLGSGVMVKSFLPGSLTEFDVDANQGQTVSDFLAEVFRKLNGSVAARTYGRSWFLRDMATSRIFDIGTPWARAQKTQADNRQLNEVGIYGDMCLEAIALPNLELSRKHLLSQNIVRLDLSLMGKFRVSLLELPYRETALASNFLAGVYEIVSSIVPPNSFGKVWILRETATGRVFDCGSSWARAHKVQTDIRAIGLIGIKGGTTLQAILI